jgi:hypothetical protein
MAWNTIVLSWRDYLLMALIGLSLLAALISIFVVAHEFLREEEESEE